MAVINEIFNPTFKKPQTQGHYRAPDEVTADDVEALKDLDISKLAELKEVKSEIKILKEHTYICRYNEVWKIEFNSLSIGVFVARLG